PVRKQQAKGGLTELSQTAQRLLAEADFDVAWIEKDDRRRAGVGAPLSGPGTLANHPYAERTLVATSATPAPGGRFDTIAKSLGLTEGGDAKGDGTWQSLDVGSPFQYAKQGILYVAAHLPRPTQSGLPDAAAEELVALVQALGGRTLGLFSSRK